MSGSYFPLDRDILTSSVWALGSPAEFKIWVYLLLEADPRDGVVEDADPGIALRCGLPVEVVAAALDRFAAPDPYSRTKDFDGSRIERLEEGGIRLLNYTRRRDRDYSTPRVRRWRERQAAEEPPAEAGAEPAPAPVKRDETVKRVSSVTETTNKNTNTNNGERDGREGEGGSGGEPRPPARVSSAPPQPLDGEREAETGRRKLADQLVREAETIAEEAGVARERVLELASCIPASGGHSESSFRDPRRTGISSEWIEATLRALPQVRSALMRPVPL